MRVDKNNYERNYCVVARSGISVLGRPHKHITRLITFFSWIILNDEKKKKSLQRRSRYRIIKGDQNITART